MKAIFIVTCFGIFTYAFAQVQKCQQYPTMKDLKPSDFFFGSWFVTHANKGSPLTTCRIYKTSTKGNSVTFDGDGYYGEGTDSKYYQVRCKGKNSGGSGKYSFTCTQQQPSLPGTPQKSVINFNLDLSIIDTDYGQYAIIYRCATYKDQNFIKDNVLILHRSRDAIKPNIGNILQQKLQMSLSTFITKKKDTQCKVA